MFCSTSFVLGPQAEGHREVTTVLHHHFSCPASLPSFLSSHFCVPASCWVHETESTSIFLHSHDSLWTLTLALSVFNIQNLFISITVSYSVVGVRLFTVYPPLLIPFFRFIFIFHRPVFYTLVVSLNFSLCRYAMCSEYLDIEQRCMLECENLARALNQRFCCAFSVAQQFWFRKISTTNICVCWLFIDPLIFLLFLQIK